MRLITLPRAVVLPKLYSNTLLVSLNNRAFIKNLETGNATPSLPSGSITLDGLRSRQHTVRIEENLVPQDAMETTKPGLELMPI